MTTPTAATTPTLPATITCIAITPDGVTQYLIDAYSADPAAPVRALTDGLLSTLDAAVAAGTATVQ
jgi:hypothetical protein